MRKPFAVAAALLAAVTGAACTSVTIGSGGNVSGGGNGFGSFLAKISAAKYKVTYQAGDETPFTIAQDPPRFSYVSGSNASYVTADGSAIGCSSVGAPPTTAASTCKSLAGGGAAVKQSLATHLGALGALFVSEAGKDIAGLGSIKSTDKSIVGRAAACATIDKNTLGAISAALLGSGSFSVCVDKATGVILESKADDGNGRVIAVMATHFGTPTDADLTPPSKPVANPGVTSTT
jgi:hypothetical protein